MVEETHRCPECGSEEHKRLVRLIRQIRKEEIAEALDLHLDDCVHRKLVSKAALDHQ